MKKNVGLIDRVIRFVAGAVIIFWGITTQNWFGAIGIVPLLTAVFQFCPMYCPLGISTQCGCGEKGSCKVKE